MNINEAREVISDIEQVRTGVLLNMSDALGDISDKMSTIVEHYEGEDLKDFNIFQESSDKLRVFHNYNEKVRGKIDLKIEELSTKWDEHNKKIERLRKEQAKLNDEMVKIYEDSQASMSSGATPDKIDALASKLNEVRKRYNDIVAEINAEQKAMLDLDKQLRNDYEKLYARLVKVPNGAPTGGTKQSADEKWRPGLDKAYENETRTKKEIEDSKKDKKD